MPDSNPRTPKPKKTRVLLVDDHPVLVQGLTLIINSEPDLEVCGQAEDAATAITMTEQLKPDLAVVDISLKSSDGINLIKDLKARQPELLTMILSLHDEMLYAERALRAGAHGYVMKQSPLPVVVSAIRKVLGGGIYLSEKMAERMIAKASGLTSGAATSPVERLSDRELEVFRKIGNGLATKEIADQLHLSFKTVETYRAHIKEKLGIDSASELIQRAALWVREENNR